MKKNRSMGLDVARCLAIMAVLMIHASAEFVKVGDTTSPMFVWGNVFDSLSRLAVPLFVMISGALMLDERRTVDVKSFYLKNALGLFILLMGWSLAYGFVYSIGKPRFLPSMLKATLQGHYHLWYMYLIISLYLLTPFLRCIVKKENKQLVQLFLVIALLTQFTKPLVSIAAVYVPKMKYIKQFMEHFYMGFFANYTAYYILGWYITHIGFKRKAFVYTLGVGSILTTMTYVHMTGDYDKAYSSMNMIILMYAVAVFTWVMSRSWHFSPMIVHLSKLSFGIYLIHPLVLDVVQAFLPATLFPAVSILVSFLLTFIGSFVVCMMIAKIPYIKKVIRM